MADMGIHVHIIGCDSSTFHELYKLCAKFHAFIKKCTIFDYAALLSE